MRKLIYPIYIMLALCITSCHKGDSLTHSSARRAAERYFNMLIDGKYEAYIDGMVDADSMPDDLRSQMADMLAQFCEGQKLNKGMLSVTATADTIADSAAYVYLDILYGDSTTEQVGMPLLFTDKRWRMQ